MVGLKEICALPVAGSMEAGSVVAVQQAKAPQANRPDRLRPAPPEGGGVMSGRRSRLPRFVVCASVSGSPFYDELSNYQGRVLCVAFGRWLIQIDIARCKP